MYSITVTDTIAIAHNLPGIPTCERLHGHNLTIEVKLSSKTIRDGMVVDFRVVKDNIRYLDHQYLNDYLKMTMPTAENIAWYLYDILSAKVTPVIVEYVRVWESDKAFAEYRHG